MSPKLKPHVAWNYLSCRLGAMEDVWGEQELLLGDEERVVRADFGRAKADMNI